MISVTELGIVIDSRLVQFAKAYPPIIVRVPEVGIFTVLSDVHPRKPVMK